MLLHCVLLGGMCILDVILLLPFVLILMFGYNVTFGFHYGSRASYDCCFDFGIYLEIMFWFAEFGGVVWQ